MDVERWRRIEELFHQAVDLPPTERAAFVQSACSDPTLVDEVLALIRQDEQDGGILDEDVAAVASRMLGETPSPPVDSIGPYRIEGLLGEGGMGVVFRARRADLDSVVAIKFLKDAALSPARRDRFFREQVLLSQLHYDGIARLYDAGVLPDRTPYFVMEYVEGKPITTYCQEQRLSVAARLRLFRDVCASIQHAHRLPVVHRDIKPSNVLVTAKGQVKLLDFGISKRLDTPKLDKFDVTTSGPPLMTPAYAAPEQLRGEPATVDADVYALGLLLYELLTGHLPFEGDGAPGREAWRDRLERDPEKPSVAGGRTLARDLGDATSRRQWADLDVLVLKALHRDRTRRYEGVDALVRDLAHFEANEPLDARPDEWSYRAGKYVERNRRWLSVAAAGVALIAALIIVYTGRLKRARDAAEAEVQRTRRIERFMFDLFDSGDHAAGVDRKLSALTLVDRGASTVDALKNDPQVHADLSAALGNIYRLLGDFAQAEPLLRSSLEQRRHLLGPDAIDTIGGALDLALLSSEQSKLKEAEALAREGVEAARRHRPFDPIALGRANDTLGKVLQTRGRYPDAIPILEDAVNTLAKAAPESPELARAMADLSNTHFYLGHYDVSWPLMEKTLALNTRLHGDQHPSVSSDLFDLGAIRAQLGYYEEALSFQRKGLAITKKWYGEENNQTAADLIEVVRSLDKLGRREEALRFAREALAIREHVLDESHPMIASVLNELGRLAREAGHFDDALAYHRRMLSIYAKNYPDDSHYLVGLAYANLATVFLVQKQWTDAEPLLVKALAVYAKTLPPTHPNVGIAQIKHGRALLGEKRVNDALADSLAGYRVLATQTNPNIEWLMMAREDLASEYRTLGQDDEAKKYLAELRHARETAR